MSQQTGHDQTDGQSSSTQQTGSQQAQAGRATTDSWAMANKDYANTRATKNSPINSKTVKDLGVAWKFSIPGTGAFGCAASAPLAVDGIVYFQDLASNVFALTLSDGQVKWKQEYHVSVVGPNGPAVGHGKVFAHVGPDQLKSLDLQTGQELWSIDLHGPAGAHQPLVYDNRVFTGVTVGTIDEKTPQGQVALRAYAGGKSGHAYAIDQNDGKTVWDFKTVKGDFWGNPQLNSGGGIWYPPAIDTKTGLTFWGTGNPAPFPGTKQFPNGSSRPGPNLYTCSILAIDHQSGELKWYRQLLEHDIFDHDCQISPVLAIAKIDGKDRDLVIGGGKLGEVAALDRNTGEVIWRVKVGKHINDQLDKLPLDQVVPVYPGILGGVETPMALADGILYVPVVNLSAPFSATGYDSKDGVEATLKVEGRLIYSDGNGEMVAIDVATGIVLWDHTLPNICFGAATVVNDLVFTSTFDGAVYALSTKDGSEVWSQKMSGGINGFLSVVGDTVIIPVGVSGEPVLIALRLNAPGKFSEDVPQQPSRKAEPQADLVPLKEAERQPSHAPGLSHQDQQLIEQGHQIYLKYGARCHQPNGEGVKGAIPKLAESSFVSGDPNPVIHMVLYGEGAMPAWINVLDNQQIAALVSYLRNAWGNQASTVTAQQVQQVKDQNQAKNEGQEQAKNRQETPGKDRNPGDGTS
jgi:outer membrane protein assembly factor BamB/mono/diheme cytochrome c family protein